MNFFITNREIIKNADDSESIREDGREHAGDNLRFGTYDLQTKAFTLFPEPEKEEDTTYQNLADKPVDELKGSAKFFRLLYDELIKTNASGKKIKKNDALFFIHGFDTDLNGVRSSFRDLTDRYVKNPACPVQHLIIFTWPGRHPSIPYHYFDDKKDAIRSGEAFARATEKVIHFFKEFLLNAGNEPCNRNIHFMVHSMGHRVLKHMMIELCNKKIAYPELFTEILLMAADIEYDMFEPDIAFNSLIDLGKRIHVYFHHNDRVLDISKFTKNFSNRLGRYGRKRIDPLMVDVVDADVTSIKEDLGNLEDRLLNHWYYYNSTEVVADVINILNGKVSAYKVKK
jgi:esterase/lipase superfamily enzyme